MSRTLYSQGSIVLETPIDSTNMWNTEAGGGGAVVPFNEITSEDILEANGKINLINVDLVCLAITTDSGGVFRVGSTVTCSANILAGTTDCLTANNGTYTVTWTGDVMGGTATGADGIYLANSGMVTFNLTGGITGGGNGVADGVTNAHGLYRNSAYSTLNITVPSGKYIAGGVGQGTGNSAYCSGIYNIQGGNITINGDGSIKGSDGGRYCYGIATSGGTWSINVPIAGGSGSGSSNYGMYISTGTYTINSTVSAGTGNVFSYGISRTGGTVTCTGNIINNTTTSAISGGVIWAPASDENYIEYPDGAGGTIRAYHDVPSPANVLDTDTVAGVAGTLSLDMPAIGDAIDIDACVCQYKMNDNAAGKLVIDAMHAYHGLAVRNTNLMHTTGKIEGGFLLDGSADYIDCNTSFQSILQDSFAVSVWVKIPSYTGTLFIFGAATEVSGKGEFILQIDTGDDTLMLTYSDIDSGFEQKEMDVPASMKSATAWTHIVINATKNDTLDIYIDGVLYGSADVSDIDFARWINSYHLTLGAFNNGGTMEGFSAIALDNFCVFNRILTADEIALLYNGGSGTETTVLDDADDSDMAEYERAAAAAQITAFGKSVIYKPFGGTEKTISAIVHRPGDTAIPGLKATAVNGPMLTVCILNDADSGMEAQAINEGKDRITLAVRLGQAVQDRLVTKIVRQDAGMVVLTVR